MADDGVYIIDGNCTLCASPFYRIAMRREDQLQKIVCTKCKNPIMALYRRLVVADKPCQCGFCSRTVYFESLPGAASQPDFDGAFFHYDEKKKAFVRHLCDLESFERRATMATQ